MTSADIERAIDAVWRIESPKVIAGLTRMTRDVGLAEDLAQDALLAALEQWPASGIPDNPAAWLTTVARRKAVDHFRRYSMYQRKESAIGYELDAKETSFAPEIDAKLDDPIGDDLLRLVFISCHPILSNDARVALTLRLLGGLTTDEIARALLASEPTIAQRIVRAKKTLSNAAVPFEVPRNEELHERLASVLAVIYFIFNEGYAATAGEDWVRPQLCEDALRLGRVVAELMPKEAEVHGLVALMEIQTSRLRARVGKDGEAILLMDQDRSRWDQLLIQRGLAALERARALQAPVGPYFLQAAIAACHARARLGIDTDWAQIAALYEVLMQIVPSPVIELNRAVAVGMAYGPEPALAMVDALADEPSLKNYYLLRSVRGDLLEKLGRGEEAAMEFEAAAKETRNERERELLMRRAVAARGLSS